MTVSIQNGGYRSQMDVPLQTRSEFYLKIVKMNSNSNFSSETEIILDIYHPEKNQ